MIIVKYSCKAECEDFVEKEKSRDPPSASKPMATAMASRMVDLPVPFSPTKKVTGELKSTVPLPYSH